MYRTQDHDGQGWNSISSSWQVISPHKLHKPLANFNAGGGIVFDSDPYDEYLETMNKLGANITTIGAAEKLYTRLQHNETSKEVKQVAQESLPSRPSKEAHIDLAAG